MTKKQPNRLAKLIDHQAFAGSALPQTLADNMRLYIQATNEIKTLLIECLPGEILSSCWVVGLTDKQLTLSVGSITAANHIRYLQNAYLQVLKEQSITFQQLEHIHVVVTNNLPNNFSSQSKSKVLAVSTKHRKGDENQTLSQNTKRTISQAAKHVIIDKNLKNALLRLAKD